jgi:hypothetical protein
MTPRCVSIALTVGEQRWLAEGRRGGGLGTSPPFSIVWLVMQRQVAWFALLALATLLALALAACSFGGSEKSASSTPESTTTTSGPPQRSYVRRCQASVRGTLDDPAWRKHSVFAGPLIFYSADQYAEQPASLFAPIDGNGGQYAGQKLLVLVRRGAVATVVLPESQQVHAALLYNPAAFSDRNAYRIENGESAVTFKACKKGEAAPVGGLLNAMTQFNGGFVVAGARCLPLEVLVRGTERTIPVTLSFGGGHCA